MELSGNGKGQRTLQSIEFPDMQGELFEWGAGRLISRSDKKHSGSARPGDESNAKILPYSTVALYSGVKSSQVCWRPGRENFILNLEGHSS
jgi:hypothetical protein